MLYVSRVEYEGKRYDCEHNTAYRLLFDAVRQEKGLLLSEKDISRTHLGKPFFKDHPHIHFSISHCRGLAACLLLGSVCGVDAEPVREFSPKAARRVFGENELMMFEGKTGGRDILFTSLWTLKEAYSKADGRGIAAMRGAEFRGSDGKIISSDPGFDFYLRMWEEFIIAAAVKRGEPFVCDIGEELYPF